MVDTLIVQHEHNKGDLNSVTTLISTCVAAKWVGMGGWKWEGKGIMSAPGGRGKHSLVCDETGRDGHPSMCHEIGQNSQQPVNMIMIGHGWS